MRVKRQVICCFIAFILIFTGICGQQLNANPMLKYALNEEQTTAIISTRNFVSVNACTTEMIRRQSFSRLRQSESRTLQIRRDLRLASQIICYIGMLNILLKFFSTEETIYFKNMDCSEVAVKYIQNTDGKK